jgi:CRISPR/Cas system Type II protein with McrA/HNH and RuvC-like nuclease domain
MSNKFRTLKGQEIVKLRSKGLSYNDIIKIVNCSKAAVAYYCGEDQKNKTKERSLKNKKSPIIKKLGGFYYDYSKFNSEVRFKSCIRKKSYEEDVNYLKNNSFCYLTGEKIDLDKPATYSLDHKIPLSRGGKRELSNMGLTTKIVNQAKTSMTPEEFIELCKKVLVYNGYKIVK